MRINRKNKRPNTQILNVVSGRAIAVSVPAPSSPLKTLVCREDGWRGIEETGIEPIWWPGKKNRLHRWWHFSGRRQYPDRSCPRVRVVRPSPELDSAVGAALVMASLEKYIKPLAEFYFLGICPSTWNCYLKRSWYVSFRTFTAICFNR